MAKKLSLLERMKKGLKGKKVTKQKKAGGVKTGVSKAPKYKGAPEAPKTSKLGKQAGAKRKKAAADKSWTKAVKAQKKTGGKTMNELIKARNAAKKGSSEYAAAQNQINKAYGSKKVHKGKKDVETKLTSKEKSKSSVGKYGDLSSEENGSSEERKSMAQGGKVESNPYGWPSRDARNGGKG